MTREAPAPADRGGEEAGGRTGGDAAQTDSGVLPSLLRGSLRRSAAPGHGRGAWRADEEPLPAVAHGHKSPAGVDAGGCVPTGTGALRRGGCRNGSQG